LTLLASALTALMTPRGAFGQAPAPTTEPVVLDFPADGVELKVLADIVTKRLGIPIIYDESINAKKVVIRVPVRVPESALLGILQSALRMKGMALVDAEQPGWKQIVATTNLAAVAKPAAAAGANLEPGAAVTQVVTLQHVDPARVVEAVRPLLTQPGGNVLPVQGQKMLVVSDYPTVIARVQEIARLLDSETPMESRFVRLTEADATTVVSTVSQMLAAREAAVWGNTGGPGVFLTADERLNQVVVLAPPQRMREVVDLVAGLDRAQELVTKVYRLKSISAERVDRLVKDLLGAAAAKRSYQSTIDRESQSLVVSATPAALARLDALIKELDQPVTAEQSPIRFYKLKNTKAADVLATIQSLTGERPAETVRTEPATEGMQDVSFAAPIRPLTDNQNATRNEPMRSTYPNNPVARPLDRVATTQPAPEVAESGAAVRTRNATVTADVNTNSIIVIAPPDAQQLYADLVKRLDIRRPQVQIECTIVTLDTSDGFTLGVDVGVSGGFGSNQIISFSSFGVSQVDPKTGSLTPVNGRGGTFALLSPVTADVVIRALSTNSRARLMSAPQLLVNDNGKGQLKSVAQEPFAQIIDSNASQAITTFGGQAEAGTSILVEPHISQDDYLQLNYTIELSNFTGQSTNGLPPPSQSNSVESTVTIPDGYTIVVGGLSTKNLRASLQSIPIIDQIPLLKWVFGTHSRTITDTTLFVFIRPVILRDDKFEDLKYLSNRAAGAASIPGDFPASDPIPLR
jgi:general secretion pathway protein D